MRRRIGAGQRHQQGGLIDRGPSRRRGPAVASRAEVAFEVAREFVQARLGDLWDQRRGTRWSQPQSHLPSLRLTFSAGLTTAGTADTPDQLYNRADRALYVAKASGRNRSTVVDHAGAVTEA